MDVITLTAVSRKVNTHLTGLFSLLTGLRLLERFRLGRKNIVSDVLTVNTQYFPFRFSWSENVISPMLFINS